jgi:hypothetical protein
MHCKQHKCLHACRANDEITCALSLADSTIYCTLLKWLSRVRRRAYKPTREPSKTNTKALSASRHVLNMNVYLYTQT